MYILPEPASSPPNSYAFYLFYVFGLVFGFGYGGYVAQEARLPSDLFGARSFGVIMGAIVFASTAGGAIGAEVGGFIHDLTHTYQWAFWVGIVASLVAGILAFSLPRKTMSP